MHVHLQGNHMGGWDPHNAASPHYADDELTHECHPCDDVRPCVVVLGHHQLSCAAGHRIATLSAPWCPAGWGQLGATPASDGSELSIDFSLSVWSEGGIHTLLLSSALKVSARGHCDLTDACMQQATPCVRPECGVAAAHRPGRRCWPGSSLGIAFAAPA